MIETLVERFVIEEYRDNCVYKTRSMGLVWVPLDAKAPKGEIYSSPSTSYKGPIVRAVHK